MNYPVSIYYGKRSDTAKSRINWYQIDGADQPELYYTMVRKEPGQKAITINKPIGKQGSKKERAVLGLFNKGKSISNIVEPDSTLPGAGYGDINNKHDAILTKRNDKAGTLVIMVFEGLGKQAKVLFQNWSTGGVCESLPDNNISLVQKVL